MKTEVVIKEWEALAELSDTADFVFEVIGLTDRQAEESNAIDGITERINEICKWGSLEYRKVENGNFGSNLLFLDTRMGEMLAEILLDFHRNGVSECRNLVKRLGKRNPFEHCREGIYGHKFKKFLYSVAMGMVRSEIWDGYDEVIANYQIVKENGDVVAYHIYNRDAFETYLLDNTRLERGSTSKHHFASIYKESDGKMYINLNLQIRFI